MEPTPLNSNTPMDMPTKLVQLIMVSIEKVTTVAFSNVSNYVGAHNLQFTTFVVRLCYRTARLYLYLVIHNGKLCSNVKFQSSTLTGILS